MAGVGWTMRASDVTRNAVMTVKITGMRQWKLRVWLGLLLVRCGVCITGAQCTVADSK